MPIRTDNLIDGTSARSSYTATASKPTMLRVHNVDDSVVGYSGEHRLDNSSRDILSARFFINGDSNNSGTTSTIEAGETRVGESSQREGNLIGSGGPTEPPQPPSGPEATSEKVKAQKAFSPKQKTMSTASTLWTLGVAGGALLLGSAGVSLSSMNEDLKKFLHVSLYSLTAFIGILFAALGLTEISDRATSSNKSTNTKDNRSAAA